MAETPGNCEVCGKPFKFPRQHERTQHKHYRNKRRTRRPSKALVKVESNHNTTMITVLENFQVITDGRRIGLVDWSFGDRVH